MSWQINWIDYDDRKGLLPALVGTATLPIECRIGAAHLNVRIRSLDRSVGDGHYTERENR